MLRKDDEKGGRRRNEHGGRKKEMGRNREGKRKIIMTGGRELRE